MWVHCWHCLFPVSAVLYKCKRERVFKLSFEHILIDSKTYIKRYIINFKKWYARQIDELFAIGFYKCEPLLFIFWKECWSTFVSCSKIFSCIFSWGGPIVRCHWPIVKFCEYNPLVPFKWIYMNCCTSIHNGCDGIIALLPEKCLHWCMGTSPLSRPQKSISYVLNSMIIQMFTQNICKKL